MAKGQTEATVWIDGDLCKGTEGCGLCIDVCRPQVLGAAESLSARGVHPAEVIHPERCTACELCVLHCPDLAVGIDRVAD